MLNMKKRFGFEDVHPAHILASPTNASGESEALFKLMNEGIVAQNPELEGNMRWQ